MQKYRHFVTSFLFKQAVQSYCHAFFEKYGTQYTDFYIFLTVELIKIRLQTNVQWIRFYPGIEFPNFHAYKMTNKCIKNFNGVSTPIQRNNISKFTPLNWNKIILHGKVFLLHMNRFWAWARKLLYKILV